ncbi:hypothetical protein A3J41_01760 [candidate division TM6 bacterium RIFCSPHIGHO2_12_FULL_38_8]|nr:MAG: hypothetical protein A3J41_01760 [candidate division TM6 bacterium RIFCSPHIGHO2_12_FULL_38_8]
MKILKIIFFSIACLMMNNANVAFVPTTINIGGQQVPLTISALKDTIAKIQKQNLQLAEEISNNQISSLAQELKQEKIQNFAQAMRKNSHSYSAEQPFINLARAEENINQLLQKSLQPQQPITK